MNAKMPKLDNAVKFNASIFNILSFPMLKAVDVTIDPLADVSKNATHARLTQNV